MKLQVTRIIKHRGLVLQKDEVYLLGDVNKSSFLNTKCEKWIFKVNFICQKLSESL